MDRKMHLYKQEALRKWRVLRWEMEAFGWETCNTCKESLPVGKIIFACTLQDTIFYGMLWKNVYPILKLRPKCNALQQTADTFPHNIYVTSWIAIVFFVPETLGLLERCSLDHPFRLGFQSGWQISLCTLGTWWENSEFSTKKSWFRLFSYVPYFCHTPNPHDVSSIQQALVS